LTDNSDAFSKSFDIVISDRSTIDRDLTGGWLIEAK
jgi:hypothetical protein